MLLSPRSPQERQTEREGGEKNKQEAMLATTRVLSAVYAVDCPEVRGAGHMPITQ